MSRWIKDITLEGQHVILEPLTQHHRDDLLKAASDGELWTLWYTSIPGPDSVDDYLAQALDMKENMGALPFLIRDKAGSPIGSSRYFNVDEKNQRLEIGYSFYAKSVQRTAVNTEAKLLLLTHAFETLGAIAVEFRTHWHNQASRAAIARLGAKQDGVLRNHQRMRDGTLRDTVVFSIIMSEWPAVKKGLQFKLNHSPS